MSGLDTSQELTDAASLKGEKLKHHPHLEGHPHAGDDSAPTDAGPGAGEQDAPGSEASA